SWTSANPDIALVSYDELVTGVKPGSTALTALLDGKSYSLSVAVKDAVKLGSSDGSVAADGTVTSALLYDDGTAKYVDVYYGDRALYTTDNYPTLDGYLFAGWYTEDNGTYTAATASNSEDACIAKFVDADVLQVKAQILSGTTASSASTDVRFISTVDGLDYESIGFSVQVAGSGKTLNINSASVFKSVNAAGAVLTIDNLREMYSPASN
ncbi:MAG: InlB B-repeat-containing protein, partial [Clostridia bacterium]|nr:InlB B-repeat-containing protein [Clostridia bacterium]